MINVQMEKNGLAAASSGERQKGHGGVPLQQIHLSVSFAIDNALDFKKLRAWLVPLLGEKETIESINAQLSLLSYSDEHKIARMCLMYTLLIVRSLFQVVGIPIFSLPKINTCETATNSSGFYNATVALDHIEHLPLKIYSQLIRSTMKTVQWMANTPVSSTKREVLHSFLDREVIGKLLPYGARGKSTLQVLKCAYELGIPYSHLNSGVYQLGWGSKSVLLDKSTTDFDSAIGARISGNKFNTASVLRSAGLPVSSHYLVKSLNEAIDAAQKLGWPVVVKPVDLERGEGVCVDIDSKKSLAEAYSFALELSKKKAVLVEKQAEGVCHRIFIANRAMLYSVKRLPIAIECDGVNSIAKILKQKVEKDKEMPPWRRTGLREMDDEARAAIFSAGYTEESIPANGMTVPLRRIESTAWGGIDEDVTQKIHPDNVDICLRAAALIGLNVAGIDIMSTDISRPWYENNAIINEINYSPLLGGGEISRERIPAFLSRHLENNGRIPLHVYVGGEQAWSQAIAQCQSTVNRKLYATNGLQTIRSPQNSVHLCSSGIYQTILALLKWRDVDELIVVLQSDELIRSGFPIDMFDKLIIVDRDVRSEKTGDIINTTRFDRLIHILQSRALNCS